MRSQLIIRDLGIQDYLKTLSQMQAFTQERNANTQDEIWCVQHPAVFTQGQAGKPEHVLNPGDIPLVQSDRGGQVTYHGPGQIVIYLLLDLKRLEIGIRSLVCVIERAVIDMLFEYHILACGMEDAPGVYVNGAKICSLGLRVKRGCCYHGLALNTDMDLEPFKLINPCVMPYL